MQLVIAEKPSVARNIAKVLHATNVKDGYLEGKEYLVSWCIGHLIELASADQYRDDWKAWKYETLPMIPENWKYQIKESTKGQFRVLKELLHRADITEVICATDAGREGELIFRLVYNQAECKLPFKRLWISSMEEKAILEGFQQMKDGHEYDNLYYSAVARSEADWLVGINATRLFTVLYHHRLIVGRVQTPTLAMLVEREKSIENFQKEKYYLVHLLMDGLDAVSNRIKEKSAAVQMMEDMKDETAQILSVKKEKKKVQPPKLYDLTTLQREANRLLGFTAQQTLDYTQSLYEKKLVTYPRTDSQYLTDDMEENAFLVIDAVNRVFPEISMKGSEPEIKRLLNSKKVSDHHAIIPTVEIANTDLKALPGGEKEILMLIASKLLCASEQEYIYESIKTEISCHGELFTASGKNVLQYGWKEVEERFFKSYGKNAEKPEEEESDFPDIKIGQVFECVVVKFSEHFTAPPKHYTEDTLLSAMEHAGSSDTIEDAERKGLGTPATRAAIIEKLIEKGFIERKKKQILPTADGRNLIRILPEMIKSPKLTAEWENDLTLISRGQKNVEEFLFEIEKMVTKLVIPADGYATAESITFVVENTADIQKVEMQDDTTKILISKVDMTDGSSEVKGAKLYILNENQEVMESWTSGDQPHYVEKLSVGTYTLLEETAPKGYIVANKVTFEVKDTGDVQGAKMEDEQAMGKVILNKTDKDTKKPMKGVEFALCDSKGKVLETLVTDSAGHAESKNYPIATFKNGQYKKAITYILKETKTLDGYQLDETEHKIQFEYVNDRTPVIEYTLDLTNKKAPEKDTPETSENQGVSTSGSHGSDATSVSNSPKTGDNTNIAIFVLVLAVSAGCLGTVVTVKRKRK